MLKLGITTALALLLAAPTVTFAAAPKSDREIAEERVAEGLGLAREGKFREAVVKFEEANRLWPHGTIQHNLGRAYEELGELKTAHDWFSRAVQKDYDFKADGVKRLADIETELRKGHAQLTIRVTPSNAEVTLTLPDGSIEKHVSTPVKTWVPAGSVKVVGTNPDFKTGTRDLTIEANVDRDLNLVLEPLPKQGFIQVNANVDGAAVFLSEVHIGTTPMSSVTHPAGIYDLKITADGYVTATQQVVIEQDQLASVTIALQPEGGEPPDITDPKVTDEDIGPPDWLGPTFLAVGAGAVVGGIVMHARAFQLNDEANQIPISNPPNPVDEARYDDKFGEAEDMQTFAFITYGVAGGLILTGAILMAIDEDPTPTTRKSTTIEPSTTGVRVIPSFSVTPEFMGGGAEIRF